MIAFLSLPSFYVRRHEATAPVAIIRDRLVLDVNQVASNRGVHPGMGIAEAKAILHKEAVLIPWKAEDYVAAQEEWLSLCVSSSDVIEPADQHTAWIDLSAHPDPSSVLPALLDRIERRIGQRPRVGLGRRKWMAELALRERDEDWVALRNPELFLAHLPIERLSVLTPAQRERLAFLGYRSVGQVATLSQETLKRQFDREALTIHRFARGRGGDSVQALYPPNSIRDRFSFESPVSDWETLGRGLEALADRLGKRLLARDLKASELRLTFEREDQPEIACRRTFSKPIHNPLSVLFALRMLAEGRDLAGTTLVRAWLPEVRKAKRNQQKLFAAGGIGSARAGSSADAPVEDAVRNLRRSLGEQAILRASEIEEPRRKRLLKVWKDATGWR